MLEVCERFNMRIDEYRGLPPGEKALYNQYTLIKIEDESKIFKFKAKTIENVTKSVEDMVNSPEWKNAETLWDKIKVAWDKLIAEPFDNWWNSTGKSWIADKAKGIGEGLGKAITFGFTALFGGDTDGIVEDGVSIGSAFGEGFAKGFDGEKVAEAIKNALSSALKLVFSNPVTGGLAAAWIGSKLLGAGTGIYGMAKSAKGLWRSLFSSGMAGAGMAAAGTGTATAGMAGTTVAEAGSVGLFGGVAQGLAIRKAAKAAKIARVAEAASMGSVVGRIGNTAEESALVFARSGKMGFGAKLGASGLGGMAAVAGGIKAGSTLISAGSDFYKSIYSTDKREAEAYEKSAAWKSGGTLAGAGIGAAIGSFVPIIGTGIGALVGAGLGSFLGDTMGDNAKESYAEELAKEEEEAAAELLAREQAKYSSDELKKALADTNVSKEEFQQRFQKVVLTRLRDAFGDINLSLAEIQNIAKKLTFGKAADSLNAFASATEEVKSDLSAFQNTALGLRKINWKASLGGNWSEDDNSEFVMTAENMVEQAKKLLTDKNYEADMAIELTLGKDSKTGKSMVEGLDKVYQDLQKQVEEKSAKLNKILNKDGVLTPKEQANANDLLNQITGITDKVTQAQNEASEQAKFEVLGVEYGGADLNYESFQRLQEGISTYKEEVLQGRKEGLEKYIENVYTRVKLDPGYSEEEGKKAIEEAKANYKKAVEELEKRISDFNLDSMATVFTNEGIADKLIPTGFEGTAEERIEKIKETITTKVKDGLILAGGDANKIDAATWIKIFGLEGSAIEAEVFANVLSPMVQNLSQGFISIFDSQSGLLIETGAKLLQNLIKGSAESGPEQGSFETAATKTAQGLVQETINKFIPESKRLAGTARKLIEDDINEQFRSEFNAGVTINLTPNIKIQAARDKLSGKEIDFGIAGKDYTIKKIIKEVGTEPTAEAEGDILTKPQVCLVAEAGPEVIIPLSEKRRNRGISLWEKAGELLGMVNDNKLDKSVSAHAAGGILTNPHIGLVAEDGAEAIIPLSEKRRNRGISLWERAGKILGKLPKHAEGGIFGENTNTDEEETEAKRQVKNTAKENVLFSAPVSITLGGINITINSSDTENNKDIMEVIRKNIPEIANETAYEIARELLKLFPNMKEGII